METNPKVDRSFNYDSVNIYYKYKIARFGNPDDLELPTLIFETPDQLCAHLTTVAEERRIPLEPCSLESPYLWIQYINKYPDSLKQEIWKFREYVYACSVLFIGPYIQNAQSAQKEAVTILPSFSRVIPNNFSLDDHKFTIVGSSELMSDIDITFQGPHASFLISIIEDLYVYMSYTANIPIRCWDVEFYGDFKLLQSIFVNMRKFNASQRLLILKYALMSYFRASHKHVNEVSPLVRFLVTTCLNTYINTTQTPEVIIRVAHDQYATEAPDGALNREFFYRELRDVEHSSMLVKPYLSQGVGKTISNNSGIQASIGDPAGIAFNMFSGIMRGNFHRAESYVVPSTAVHVVEFEQKKAGMFRNNLPESWLSSNARIGIDAFGFIISAIEQLGYLEHYHESIDMECNKKGIKYFGRMIRALVQAGLLRDSSQFIATATQLNAYRSSTDPDAVCGQNIHTLLKDILNVIKNPTGIRRTQAIRRLNNITRRKRQRRNTRRRL